jgi:hypothetical protein
MRKMGTRDVPVVAIGERNLTGYDDGAWHAALDGAGYPRTALPGQSEAVRQASKPPGQPPANAPAAEPSPGK